MKQATTLATGLLFAALTTMGHAQSVFHADFSAELAVPPVTTNAGGTGVFVVDAASGYVDYDFSLFAMAPGTSIADLGLGLPGISGTTLAKLDGGPNHFSGRVLLSALDLEAMRRGELFVNVRNHKHLTGELRAQLVPARHVISAECMGANVIPANPSSAHAFIYFFPEANDQCLYYGYVKGFDPVKTSLHDAVAGQTGHEVYELVEQNGVPGSYAGSLSGVTPTVLARLRGGRYYLRVTSAAYPTGELRGQVESHYTHYGQPCPSGPNLGVGYQWTTIEESLLISIQGAESSAPGFLAVGVQPRLTPLPGGCTLYLDPLVMLPVTSNGQGKVDLEIDIPQVPLAPSWTVIQFFGASNSAPLGFTTSNAASLRVRL